MSGIELKIKTIILQLIEDLKDNVFVNHGEISDMHLIRFYFTKLSPESISNHAIKHILPHKSNIIDRNLVFFTKNKHIFMGLPNDKIEYYSRFIASDLLSEENREIIWSYFDIIIKLLEKYKKRK